MIVPDKVVEIGIEILLAAIFADVCFEAALGHYVVAFAVQLMAIGEAAGLPLLLDVVAEDLL